MDQYKKMNFSIKLCNVLSYDLEKDEKSKYSLTLHFDNNITISIPMRHVISYMIDQSKHRQIFDDLLVHSEQLQGIIREYLELTK